MTDFENKKGMSPQKVGSKTLFLGALEITRPLFWRYTPPLFGRTDLKSEITRVYP